MSLKECRSYLRARSNAVGLKEWTDGVNIENIPSTLINKSFSLGLPSGDGIKLNQHDQEINFENQVKVFIKGYRDNATTIDNAVAVVDDLIKECVTPRNRLTQTSGIKNVVFENFSLESIGASNDNIIAATITFKIYTVLGL